ncbi:uncharacterized protein TNCV_892461 [Trichonephila clavipes]|nr:uncharacterized protein TNCV_892461 [Trichonephila clavipes]
MDIVSKLRHSFYVDNCVTGVSDTQETGSFVNKVRKIMSNGCFNLRGWESNVKKEFISKCEGDTKGIFDPLGILTAATLLPKMWLQETWKVKLACNSPLPLGLCNKFDKWFKEILLLQNLEIPRYCEMNSDSDLHVFVVASKEAYATCIFVRTKLASGIKLHLLRANARVAPTKSVSMSRLELLACVGTRLANSIRNLLDIPDLKITYWSDFMVALHLIKNNGEWSTFVSNRIKEIAKISSPENWRHVPGRMNPADVLSRGCSPRHLLENKCFGGPEWLLGDAVTWPTNELQLQKAHKTTQALNVGEIVLIENPNKKRLYWPLGKVIELIPGRDGKVRTLKLICSNSEIIRPIQRVFPLEIQSAEMGESNDVPLYAEALKIPSVGVDVSESALPVNAPPNMPKVSRYGRTIQRPRRLNVLNVTTVFEDVAAAVAEWYRYRTVACFVTGSSPVPLKTRRVGQRCTLNLSRAETSSRWCGVVVRRGGASSGFVHVT